MNEKGFTLIELLVTLVLLIIITTSVVLGIQNTFRSLNDDTNEEFYNKIEMAACIYAENENIRDRCTDKNVCKISQSINEIVEAGYLDKDLIDPKTGEVINLNSSVKIEWKNGQKICTYE